MLSYLSCSRSKDTKLINLHHIQNLNNSFFPISTQFSQPSMQHPTRTLPGEEVKAPNLIERAKEEIEAIVHHAKSSHHHRKETHGRRDDIDENTPIDEVKGPSVFQRAKEEIEALVETIHSNNESSNYVTPPKEGRGFWSSIGRWLESVCGSSHGKRD